MVEYEAEEVDVLLMELSSFLRFELCVGALSAVIIRYREEGVKDSLRILSCKKNYQKIPETRRFFLKNSVF